MAQPTCRHGRHTALVVDDEPGIAAILREILQDEGLDVIVAHRGDTALDLVRETTPCLALVDVMMPGLSGLGLCRQLKQDPRTAAIPVVLVSARTAHDDVMQGLEAGADDYLQKPFDRETVRFRVRAHLRLHSARLEEQRLRERLTVISRAAQDAIVVMDGQGAVTHWNEAAEAMFGYSRAEALGCDLHELIAPPSLRVAYEQVAPAFHATGQGAAVGTIRELTARRKSGEEFPVELSMSGTIVDGEWWAVGVVRDVTSRQRSEQRFRSLFERSRDALLTLAPPDWYFTSGNPAAVALFCARDEADLVSRAPWEYSPPLQPNGRPSLDCSQEWIDAAMQTGAASFAWTHRTVDGRDFAAHVSLTRIELGGQLCLHATVRDVTAEQQLQLELSQARKLQAVGQLAAGIAHEINTPNQYVGDSVHFLREAFAALTSLLPLYRQAVAVLDPAAPLAAEIRRLEQEADLGFLLDNVPSSFERSLEGLSRVADIVRAMREFAQPEQRQMRAVDLNEALASTLIIARNEYKYVAEIETDFGDLPLVVCHSGDLNQVFLNLIVNAAHAIAEVVRDTGTKGTIQVRTRHVDHGVVVQISDSGAGIPEASRDRVFEPFFTTKPVGQGSGQGLAIARTVVVDRHGGTLTFESAAGQGTTFTIRLPVGREGLGPDGSGA